MLLISAFTTQQLSQITKKFYRNSETKFVFRPEEQGTTFISCNIVTRFKLEVGLSDGSGVIGADRR